MKKHSKYGVFTRLFHEKIGKIIKKDEVTSPSIFYVVSLVLEHEQWMAWAQHILATENISEEIRKRWEADFVPYAELPEPVKNLDRPFARKSLGIIKN